MKRFKQVVLALAAGCALLSNTAIGFAQSNGEANTGPQKIFVPMISVAVDNTEQGNGTPSAQLIPGQYMVILKDDLVASASVNAIAAEMASQYGGELLHTYDVAVYGFAIKLPIASSVTTIQNLAQDSRVAYVEQDSVMTIADEAAVDTTQTGATWGLDRIDQRNLPLSGSFTYVKTGAGVRAYIIDTGIHTSHSQFGTRASYGYDAVDGSLPADDCNGHGTHVAGTVGGSTYGVAKGVALYAVRVLDCNGSGSTSGVVSGINWVASQKAANPSIPMVANMSLGGSASSTLDNAVQSAINKGITCAIAGGNSNANACNYSPARVTAALTVGATTSTDARASYSNYGTCLDLFAPGSSITSAWYTSNTATNTISGTSMATPHVAGVAALYLQGNPSASPAAVASALTANATASKVTSAGSGSPNRLLFTNY
jgi:subtilisin family serine protease